MYKYRGFGLNIASEIPFREFSAYDFSNPADLEIIRGNTPQHLSGEDVLRRARVEFGKGEYLLKVENIANYYITNGSKAVIESLTDDEDSIRLFFLSSGIAAALHQKGKIPLHASGVHNKDGVTLFVGESGAGKSTTVSLLQKIGYRIFTDDVCVVDNDDLLKDKISVYPSYPVIKLWSNTIDELNIDTDGLNKYKVRRHLPKVGIVTPDIGTEKLAVGKIIVIRKDNHVSDVSIEPLTGVDVFKQLQKETYRRNQVDALDIRKEHFRVVSMISSKVPVFVLKRPGNLKSFDDVTDCLNKFFNE